MKATQFIVTTILALFFVTVLALIGAAQSAAPGEIPVPDVVGLRQVEAEATILATGLAVGEVSYSHSATIPAENVMSQDPVAGTTVPPESPINLVVSIGPELVGNTRTADSGTR